ncbi:MAG: hypothetical protein CMJ81_10280 [Planctomycetaceae bacterium]|jgi:hypothetical protein|nr:hypothetical protein [Planctomycetaceae bacterium]MBP60987.1 hypothetical protein [Planctomycetaceae bacterium]
MDPVVTLTIVDRRRNYAPGETIVCEYTIESLQGNRIQAVEASVLWYTEGKGDEDMLVHYFARSGAEGVMGEAFQGSRRFQTELPKSPLSYEGSIVKIQWCARIRVFLTSGAELHHETPFHLGEVPRARSRSK